MATAEPREPDKTKAERRAMLEDLARQQGVKPVRSAEDLKGDLFDTDEELDEFLAHVRRERDADRA